MSEIDVRCPQCGEPLLVTVMHETDVIVLYVNPCEECLHRVFIEEYRETLSDRERNWR